ncbi:Gfo/Idh/MocA family protein [Aquibacillus salsiterrae]|uniref:Gfo/Idh/MocA family oxidoreductase n=1 Tax=Aquibacillus salsiterrae TaxID=2950439 RepID=A0A9X3WGM9_9BACI|nr:Gfo/Idh/MocA family oxidoreductase [Aquibacillus salsiterrae]MDC3418035.1 Gfo/Idh/MocA family oxidoreductase [Aquibacillus salsiterrae]
MKVGIISFAHMHAQSYAKHLLNLNHPDVSLSAIWDEDQQRGEAMATQYQSDYYQDLDAFLQTDIEAVVICSENANHKLHVTKAARAKKHILCEKPIATEIDDAKEMIAVCREEDVTLQVAYPVRFSPVIKRVKEIVTSGQIGDVVAINGTNHGQMPGGWFVDKSLSGGGAATDHIVHIMDLVRWLLNDEVKSVYAELDTRFYDIEVEDCGIVSLELESGVIVTIDPSWSRPKTFPTWGDVTVEITGTKGNLSVDALKQHSLYYNDADQQVQQLPWGSDIDGKLIDDFIDCVKSGRDPSISGEDGLRTLEVVKAAYRSAHQKQSLLLERVEI